MSKYFCSDCGQTVDDVVCPVCGNPAEDLRFDEGSPDGRSDRYDDSLMAKVVDVPDVESDDDADPTTRPLATENDELD